MNLYNRNQLQRTFFNEKIDTYDEVHKTYMETKKQIISVLKKDTKKVLDLGVGTGLELIYFFQEFKDSEVTAIDISENMLNELKKRPFSDKVNIICGDFFEVDFGKDYDAVISTSALHHFTKEEKYILYKKIYESLKPNGVFINCDKISLTEEEQEHYLFELNNNIENYKHIDTPLTIDNEVKILKETNFNNITSQKVDKEDYSLIVAKK